MATTSLREEMIQKRVQELLDSRLVHSDPAETVAELRRAISEYEARYGIPSARIHDAINEGELIEDVDVGHWIFQYDLLNSLEEK